MKQTYERLIDPPLVFTDAHRLLWQKALYAAMERLRVGDYNYKGDYPL